MTPTAGNGKLPPQDIDAERAMLGAMLANKDALSAGISRLTADAFMLQEHRDIFGGLAGMHQDGVPVDLVTAKHWLIESGKFNGGTTVELLTRLAESVPSIANATFYCAILDKLHRKRELLIIGRNLQQAAVDPMADPGLIAERLRDELALQEGEKTPAGGTYPEIIPASLLGQDATVNWVWHGYLARGSISLFSGLWKCGKTTLIAHLLKALEAGGNLGGSVMPSRALVVTEESRSLWAGRRDALGLTDNVDFIVRPFRAKPSLPDWYAFVAQTTREIIQRGYGVVIVDPLLNVLPIVNENDAAEVMAALLPLTDWCEHGAGVLLCHHPRKGDAAEGQAARGSGALSGFVDVLIELRRFAPNDRDDCRRVLTTYSRFAESPPEQVLELTPAGYRASGTKSETVQESRLKVIRSLLPTEGAGLTADAIRDAWPEGSILPSRKSIQRDLEMLVRKQLSRKLGTGKRADPYSFLDTPLERGLSGNQYSTGLIPFPDTASGLSGNACPETGVCEP